MEDKVNRQAVMRQRALCRYNLGEISAKEKRVKLNEALQLTIPHWDGKKVPGGVFTRTECGIICNIAVSYMQEENYQEALDIMRQMQKYFETTRMNEEEKCVSEGLLEKRVKLNEALQLTIPHWDGKKVPGGVFTRTECGIICNIAVSYMQEENYQEALDIMRQMQKYFETTRMNEEEKCVSEGLLLSNMSQCQGRSGETEEALVIDETEAKRDMTH